MTPSQRRSEIARRAYGAGKILALSGPPALLSCEDIDRYMRLLLGFVDDFSPKTAVERVLIRNFLDETWNLFRIQRYKAAMLERQAAEIRKREAERDKAKAQMAAALRKTDVRCDKTERPVSPQTKLERIVELEEVIIGAVAEVDATYERVADDETYTRSFQSMMDKIQELEIMETRALRRRDSILKHLERIKEGWRGPLSRGPFRDEVEFQCAMQKARAKLHRNHAAAKGPNGIADGPDAASNGRNSRPDVENGVPNCHAGSSSEGPLSDHDGIPREGVLPNDQGVPPGQHAEASGHDEVANRADPGINIPAAALNGQSEKPQAESAVPDSAVGVTNGKGPGGPGASSNHGEVSIGQNGVSVPQPHVTSSPGPRAEELDSAGGFVNAVDELAAMEAADAWEKDEPRRNSEALDRELDEEFFNALREKNSREPNKRPQESRAANGTG